jgi:hypothetical protein
VSTLFIKRASASDNVLLFLVSASFSVLATRFLLDISGYPQIARGNLHLAHAIFGGLFLSIANVLMLTLHGKKIRQASAIIAGLGFGQFIDELGKFITRDNNYFFQPVPMLIYLTFIFLFFLYHYLDKYTPRTPKEIIYEVFEYFEEFAENNFHAPIKQKITHALQRLLEDSAQNYHLFARGILHTVEDLPVVPKPKAKFYVQRIRSSWHWLEEVTTERRPVFYFLLILFLIYLVISLSGTITLIQIVVQNHAIPARFKVDTRFDLIWLFGELISQTFSAIFMTRGFLYLVRRRRIRALEFFKIGLAINILITHVFTFYFRQFSTIPELLLTLAMFAVVHNILEEERS